MKVFADENVPLMTVQALRDMGHDVLDIRGTPQQGLTDDAIWDMVHKEGRILITTDKGFTQRREASHHGILIVRLRQPNRRKIHDRVMQAMSRFAAKEWPGLLVVMRDVVQSTWRSGEKG